MQRYFVNEANWSEDKVTITEDAHHIIRVMRYEIEDTIICVHSNGNVAECEIIELDEANNRVVATIRSWFDENTELAVQVTILQSLPKGSKLELIIQKGTELGARQFILYESERSIVKWNTKKLENRLQRYRKIAKEASEQSGRAIIPDVFYMDNIEEVFEGESFSNAIKLLAYEEEAKDTKHRSLFTELNKVKQTDHIIVGIGPEGGFSNKEVATFKENGFTTVRLGKRILRTETASLYALASISYHLEEMKDI